MRFYFLNSLLFTQYPALQAFWISAIWINQGVYIRKNINNLRYAHDTTLMAETEKELKSPWREWERRVKAGLKLNIHKTKIMASGPITSCQTDAERSNQWHILFSWVPKSLQMVNAPIKMLAPWEKSYDKPGQHIKKQRHHFSAKGLYSQSYGFSSSQTYGCE